jgi:hypothetical protein
MAEASDVRVAIAGLADKVATMSISGRVKLPGDEAKYLEAFRVAYRHMIHTVYGDPGTTRETETVAEADTLWATEK